MINESLSWLLGVYLMALGGLLLGISLGIVMILAIALLDGLADWLLCKKGRSRHD